MSMLALYHIWGCNPVLEQLARRIEKSKKLLHVTFLSSGPLFTPLLLSIGIKNNGLNNWQKNVTCNQTLSDLTRLISLVTLQH